MAPYTHSHTIYIAAISQRHGIHPNFLVLSCEVVSSQVPSEQVTSVHIHDYVFSKMWTKAGNYDKKEMLIQVPG
jgi:hypothetical protein